MQIAANSAENGPDGHNITGDHVSDEHTDMDNKEVNGSAHEGNYANVGKAGDSHGVNNDGNDAANPLLMLIEKHSSSTSTTENGLPERSRQQRKERQRFFGKFRFCIALLLALATYSYTSMRMNLGMAIVCMVNSTAVRIKERAEMHPTELNNTSSLTNFMDEDDEKCPAPIAKGDLSKSMGYQGTLEWSTAEQARLFGATFYGSFVTVWFSGYLADRFGAKLLIALAIADYSLVSLLSPWFVSIDYSAFFWARLFMGFGEGFVMPTLASASARWFPPNERSFMAAVCTLGNQIAALVALLLSSRLCALEIFGGWPTIFYSFGMMGVISLTLWCLFSSNSPEESPWIGQAEQKMITASLAGQRESNGAKRLNSGPLPWRKMLLSMPLYAAILGQGNYTFCNVIMQSYLPTFFKEVVQLNLKNNGFFSVIPFVAMIVSKIAFGILADALKKRRILSATNTVKLFQGISNFGAALAACGMALFVNCQTPALAGIFLALWGISYGASTSGFFTLLLCIEPRYTGTITSLSTAMGIVGSGISPIVVSAIVKHGTSTEWRIIWCILVVCNICCAIFFLIFASAKQQNWSSHKQEAISIEIQKPRLTKIVR